MSNVTYKREELESKTVKELKNMCVYDLEIPGMTKKAKGLVIAAILKKCGSVNEDVVTEVDNEAYEAYVEEDPKPIAKDMKGMSFSLNSIMTKPTAQFGNKTTTTIHVSCGASSGEFPVVGRTVYEVGEFLREVLNVTRMSIGLVNGKEVDHDYVIQVNDNLEYLKPAGQKGII